MSAKFSVGDRVKAAWNGRVGVVVNAYDERFPIGGVQQVVAVQWADGTGTAMRAAHFTPESTEQAGE